MPDEVLEVTKRFMREPIRILVKKEELTLEGIRQFYIQVEKEVWQYLIEINKFKFALLYSFCFFKDNDLASLFQYILNFTLH